ncbi:hypothetical protein KAFR_0G03180 [Kazachstania africana CBS 2517]|uniref:Serine aminopeptidase S33 domain-containing protein n=1 Tax=Kazachstania africana (strain ATCC 22294 / BCRC 22015 / CBS 2517 / CECT 1963 / NBRC 1671 / NRRL Y-8276) TaxID=1071382 RepID=H2AYA0_KAZAF|nr:hypothetical protein KAFR_0G03180 [Kazachstania africana CBS 2517]CCF59350.1 hypothetical protein KAFR_0G03180 [Kazachstania africana CBS 2517]
MDRRIHLDEDAVLPSYLQLEANEKYLLVKDSEVHCDKGLSTILSVPTKTKENSKIVILLHGHQSHKNALYQPLLSQELSKMGYFVIRFDFRGQGDSEPNRNENEGRTITQDLEDMNAIISSLDVLSTSYNISFQLEMVVAHSRGVLIMFEYLLNNKPICVPKLVNCSGRFVGSNLLKRYSKLYPNWREAKGFGTKILRYGKVVSCWVPETEIISTANVNGESFANLSKESYVLIIHGSCDDVIPLEDANKYESIFQGHCHLIKIRGADHNYYGLEHDPNTYKLPIKRGKVNYSVILVREILSFLQGRTDVKT